MASNLDKSTILNMENTAKYQEKQDLNIKFSTADRDSAVFVFNVTKNKKPLLLSEENVLGHIALKHSDGSFIKDTLHFTEHDINGKFEYYIPNELLKREGTVTMQVFISEKGNSNVIVAERIVTFDIEKSIISQISAETKLQYIVEYDELQAVLTERLKAIEEQMANSEDYVSQLKQAKEQGLSDLEIARTSSIEELNNKANAKITELENKAKTYSNKFDDDKKYMDDKHQEFKDSILNSEVVTQGESKEWQKYKLTNDNGSRIYIKKDDFIHIDNLPPGFYETVTNGEPLSQGIPSSIKSAIIEIDVMEGIPSTKRKQYKITQNYNNRTWIKTIHTNGDIENDWKEIVSLSEGESVETKSSAQVRANETLTDANQYTDNKLSTQKKVLFEGNAKGMGTSINLLESYKNYKYLFITFDSPRGMDTIMSNNSFGDNNIILTALNLSDEDGSTMKVYEVVIVKENDNKLVISNEVFNNLKTGTTGKDKEGSITVVRVEGWN